MANKIGLTACFTTPNQRVKPKTPGNLGLNTAYPASLFVPRCIISPSFSSYVWQDDSFACRRGLKATEEYEACQRAMREKTARLRALRLARDQVKK